MLHTYKIFKIYLIVLLAVTDDDEIRVECLPETKCHNSVFYINNNINNVGRSGAFQM